MEIDSSRRSREPGLKKPRLAEDAPPNGAIVDRSRPFPQKPPAARGAFRPRDRDNGREDPSTEPYRPEPQQLQPHQQQEIVGQYKTALAELTFNSKPIITNLTIIAGENVPAAKGISAAVCANILEVPSDQKLPSLYLLDSIVKNIGREYIKYFAPRLPEVFCKAFREVDSSIHPAMRHLFGTWKGVFHAAILQMIERELGFSSMTNGSSSRTTTSRPDFESPRPAHSIHVNPKYLEARQRLQQSSRSKGMSSDNSDATVTSSEDSERPNRTAFAGSSRPWADTPAKIHNMQRPQREHLNEPTHEKNSGMGYGDYEFISDLSQSSYSGDGKGNDKVAGRKRDKPWYGAANIDAASTAGERKGSDVSKAYGHYQEPRSAQTLSPMHPSSNAAPISSRETVGSWKNSEEEEYMWEDMNTRLTDHGGTENSRKDHWNQDSIEKPAGLQRSKWIPLEAELDTRWNVQNMSKLEQPCRGGDRIPSRREVEDHCLQPRDLPDYRSRFKRESSTESPSRENGGQAALGHQTAHAWSTEDPHLVEDSNSNAASKFLAQASRHPIRPSSNFSAALTPSLARTRLQPSARPSVAPSSFGSLANVIPGSSGLHKHQQPLPMQPTSPPTSTSRRQSSHSPSSSVHENQHSHNLSDLDHQQAQSLPQPHQRFAQLAEQSNRVLESKASQVSSGVAPQNQIQSSLLPNSQLPSSKSSLEHLQNSLSSALFDQLRHHLAVSQPPQNETLPQPTQPLPSGESDKPSSQPTNFSDPQTLQNLLSGHSDNAADSLGQSSAASLLLALVKNELVSSNSLSNNVPKSGYPDSSTSNLSAQPPLPSGPPPVQVTSSSSPVVTTGEETYQGNISASSAGSRVVLPPLPPGPPPSSLHIDTSSLISNQGSTTLNPLTSLLSSLVAKGLISEPAKELSTDSAHQTPVNLQNQNTETSASASMPASSSSLSSSLPTSSKKDFSLSESTAEGTSLSQATNKEVKGLIGTEFKLEIIRESHPLVVDALIDELPHQCGICGLRLKLEDQFSRHLDWHTSMKQELSSCKCVSRKWFASSGDWITGNVGPSYGPMTLFSMETTTTAEEKCEPMVPADESQVICAFCGEPFEDFYSEERDEWMYKGAVYMTISDDSCDTNDGDESSAHGPIVHANCMSRSSNDEFELTGPVELEPVVC